MEKAMKRKGASRTLSLATYLGVGMAACLLSAEGASAYWGTATSGHWNNSGTTGWLACSAPSSSGQVQGVGGWGGYDYLLVDHVAGGGFTRGWAGDPWTANLHQADDFGASDGSSGTNWPTQYLTQLWCQVDNGI